MARLTDRQKHVNQRIEIMLLLVEVLRDRVTLLRNDLVAGEAILAQIKEIQTALRFEITH